MTARRRVKGFHQRSEGFPAAPYLGQSAWRKRSELRPAIIDQLHQAATAALKASEKADA